MEACNGKNSSCLGKASQDKKALKLSDGLNSNILLKERVIKILNDVNNGNISHSQN